MLIECHECGGKVSTEAAACMSCGAPPKATPQNFQQAAPPLSSVKAPDPVHQQPQHHLPYRNPDGKMVLINSIEQCPQETTKQVSFGAARYRFACPQCKEIYRVGGKSLGSRDSFKCPNKACGWRTPTKDISLTQVEGELVVYNRIKDYFSYDGRISVGDYWLSVLVALPVILIAKVFAGALYPLILFGVLHPLWIKRYHDHGFRSEWVIIQAIASVTGMLTALVMPKVIYGGETYPLLAFVHGLALMVSLGTGIFISFFPSTKGLNRYGPPTSKVKKVWS
jgi:uncharacterized membrane protein YhaH (DUF805 family)/predicted RNA-binding Zn-ribbon protein involved in translation (DUF1610 family)